MAIYINAPETKQTFYPIAITVNKQNTSCTYLQTAPKYKKSGNTTNHTTKS